MHIRDFTLADTEGIMGLFHETVHAINSRDYTPQQLAAWAPEAMDAAWWREHLAATTTLVAENAEMIVGFANLDGDDHLDCLYVHHRHQSAGIGAQLLQRLEAISRSRGARQLSSDVSITARPFFERHGYAVVREQLQERRGQTLLNFHMAKTL